MDGHFDAVLAPSVSKQHDYPFIPAKLFEGSKYGYKFQRGSKGTGYYYDRIQLAAPKADQDKDNVQPEVQEVKKRKRDKNEATGSDASSAGANDKMPRTIEQILEEAEENGLEEFDAASLRQRLISLDKKISRNQKMRMKYPDEPEKFMESEIELHQEIQELFVVAASPELYPILVQYGAVQSILSLISHENTDISIAIVNLLQELTDVDTVAEALEEAMQFVDCFVEQQGLELVVQNLGRLDESNEQMEANDGEAEGIHNSLGIVENLVEIKPEIAVQLCRKTRLLTYLLGWCQSKRFDAKKLVASEILSILLQANEANQVALCSMQDCNGMDTLLQCIAVYRKKEVTAADEQECVENLFLSLCAVLQTTENQSKFMECEGFELLIRCLKEYQYAAGCTIKALNYAIMKNQAGCGRFVDVGGLKYIFPLLTGLGVKRLSKKTGSSEKRSLEENAVSIVAQLCTLLCKSSENDYAARLLNKFVEQDYEKLERCVELYGKYTRVLKRTDAQIGETRERIVESGDDEALEEFDDEENINTQRIEGGLFSLQQVAIILSFTCVYSEGCWSKASRRLASESNGVDMDEVLSVLRGVVLSLQPQAGESDARSEISQVDLRYKQVLTEWCALMSNRMDGKV